MSDAANWARGYARQAAADFQAWEHYQNHLEIVVADCHRLLFLQMACEKLCKAYVLHAGIHSPTEVRASHGFIGKHLPTIINQEIASQSRQTRRMRWAFAKIRHLAGEIEVLSPAMDRDGKRPDNCEYPWSAGDEVVSPLDWNFTSSQLLIAEAGRTFLKLLGPAIDRLINSTSNSP